MKVIRLNEDIGIKNIKKFHSVMNRALEEFESFTLDFSPVQRADLSVLQVIRAAELKAKKENMTIRYRGINERLKNQFRIFGLAG